MITFTFMVLLAPSAHDCGWEDGSVIMIDDGFLSRPIARHTGSTLSHTAIVLDGYVYEATWPRARRMPASEYARLLEYHHSQWNARGRNMSWCVLEPTVAYTDQELQKMRCYAQQQLGRRYMVRGWWTRRRVRGIHCSEFVANVLACSGKYGSRGPRESPVTVWAKVNTSYQRIHKLDTRPAALANNSSDTCGDGDSREGSATVLALKGEGE